MSSRPEQERSAPPPDDQRARIEAMQFEQVPVEGGPAKGRLALLPSRIVAVMAALLPIRIRTAFGFALNFVFNRAGVSLRLLLASVSAALSGTAIFLLYFLVVGPTALFARLLGQDDLTTRPAEGTMFQAKELPDQSEERFLRPY